MASCYGIRVLAGRRGLAGCEREWGQTVQIMVIEDAGLSLRPPEPASSITMIQDKDHAYGCRLA